jgi:hypothetical protein
MVMCILQFCHHNRNCVAVYLDNTLEKNQNSNCA